VCKCVQDMISAIFVSVHALSFFFPSLFPTLTLSPSHSPLSYRSFSPSPPLSPAPSPLSYCSCCPFPALSLFLYMYIRIKNISPSLSRTNAKKNKRTLTSPPPLSHTEHIILEITHNLAVQTKKIIHQNSPTKEYRNVMMTYPPAM